MITSVALTKHSKEMLKKKVTKERTSQMGLLTVLISLLNQEENEYGKLDLNWDAIRKAFPDKKGSDNLWSARSKIFKDYLSDEKNEHITYKILLNAMRKRIEEFEDYMLVSMICYAYGNRELEYDKGKMILSPNFSKTLIVVDVENWEPLFERLKNWKRKKQ